MVCSDAAGEAEAVADRLELYWSKGLVPASEMAVLYRTNAQSRSFEEACHRRDLPYMVVGAQRFSCRQEVRERVVDREIEPCFRARAFIHRFSLHPQSNRDCGQACTHHCFPMHPSLGTTLNPILATCSHKSRT